MSLPPPLALSPCLPTELLSYVLQQTCTTTLIICGTRAAFLSALVEATSPPSPKSPTQQSPDPGSEQPLSSPKKLTNTQDKPSVTQLPQRHPVLIPTLHQISRSRRTTTSFIPTVSHLRAYLSVFSASPTPPLPDQASKHGDLGTRFALLLVYGLVGLHRGTSEWSTQGLGNTLAALVEAGWRVGRRVVLVEPQAQNNEIPEEQEAEGADSDDGGDYLRTPRVGRNMRERSGPAIWHEKLPMLSGSVRRVGAETEYGGRTVEVGVVLRRWFTFGEWDNGCFI